MPASQHMYYHASKHPTHNSAELDRHQSPSTATKTAAAFYNSSWTKSLYWVQAIKPCSHYMRQLYVPLCLWTYPSHVYKDDKFFIYEDKSDNWQRYLYTIEDIFMNKKYW